MQTLPRAIERDNQNSLRKYPFSDAASCSNGTAVIPCGAIVDAQLYLPGREAGEVWLSAVDGDGILRFSDAAGEFAETIARPQAGKAVPVRFTGTGGPLPGGVVVFGKEDAVSALASLSGTTFSADETSLAAAAVTFTGIGGVSGFLLDDGNVVSGEVRFRGTNGCDVATFVDEAGRNCLRISAVGIIKDREETTGFITRIVAESRNDDFVVAERPSGLVNRVIDVMLSGAREVRDMDIGVDQDDACANVRRSTGSGPAGRAVPGDDCICRTGVDTMRTITFHVNGFPVRTTVIPDGGELGNVPPPKIDMPGMRFSGYFDSPDPWSGKLYYRHDGTGVGRMNAGKDLSLYAHVIAASSRAEVRFNGYGTLHLNAPSTPDYNNPVRITGGSGVPVVRETGGLVGGTNALSDIVLHPSSPSGSVTISVRGFNKVTET